MNDIAARRFVTAAEKVDFVSPWTLEEWICRSDVVKNEQLLLAIFCIALVARLLKDERIVFGRN